MKLQGATVVPDEHLVPGQLYAIGVVKERGKPPRMSIVKIGGLK